MSDQILAVSTNGAMMFAFVMTTGATSSLMSIVSLVASGSKRVIPFCICFYCICCAARVELRQIIYPFRRVTAQASHHSAHDGEGEGKRGLGMGLHRVNYTIFAALRVGFGLVIRWLGG